MATTFESSAALTDSLKQEYDHFLKVLRSNDLSNRETLDSVWFQMPWNWMDVEQEKFDEAVALIQGRIDATSDIKDRPPMHELLLTLFKNRQMLGKAVVQYDKKIAIHTVLKDSMQVIRDYHWLSWMYHHNKLYEESLITYQKVIELQRPMKMTEELANNIWTCGYLYSVAGWEMKKPQYQDSAVKYLGQAFYYCLEIKGDVHLEWIITYAMSLARQGEKRQAIAIAEYGLEIANKYNEPLYLARFNKQLSNYYLALGMEDSAYYRIYESAKYEDLLYAQNDPNAIRLHEKEGRLHMFNLGFLIDIHTKFGHYDRAQLLLDRILYGPEKIRDEGTLMYYRALGADVYFKNGDFEKAAYNYQLEKAYSDSVYRAEVEKSREVKTAQLGSQIALEKERAGIEKKQHDELARKEKERLRIIIYSVIGIAGITSLFLVFMFRRFKVSKRQNSIIDKQKQLVESSFNQLETKNREILDSIYYAKTIQSAILPPKKTIETYLPNSFIWNLPKDIVSGDFYWLEHKDGKTVFAAADCTGHGVPGAMVSVICNNGLNRSVREYGITDPGKILDKTREIVMSEFEKSDEEVNDGMDIALCSIETSQEFKGTTILKYAGAHNPLWIIRNGGDEIEEYKATKQPIGKYFHSEAYNTVKIEVNAGDMMYIFTDGFADQFGGERGKKYQGLNFQKFLLSIKDLPLKAQEKALFEEFTRWKGEREQLDDILVIGVRFD